MRTAIVKAQYGYVVELLEYSNGLQNGTVPNGTGSIGAAHLALTAKDIHAVIACAEAAGWKAKGNPQPIPGGPRKGMLVAYVSGPDHITIELCSRQPVIEPAAALLPHHPFKSWQGSGKGRGSASSLLQ